MLRGRVLFRLSLFLLRLAVAFPLLYASINGFLHPDNWIGFLPPWLPESIPTTSILPLFSLFELVLAAWLLIAPRVKYPALIAALFYAGIVLADPSQFLITFRDVGLFFAALALAGFSAWRNVLDNELEKLEENEESEPIDI